MADVAPGRQGGGVEQLFAAQGPWLIYLLVGLLTFGESAAFLGLLLPGEIALVAAAALAPARQLSWLVLFVLAVTGACLGGLVGYEVSRRHGERLVRWAPIARKIGPEIEAWASRMEGRGALGLVIVSRFNQVTRAIVPALAGITSMARGRFAAANLVGAVAWAGAFTAIGYSAAEWWKRTSGPLHLVTGLLVVVGAAGWSLLARRRRAHMRS